MKNFNLYRIMGLLTILNTTVIQAQAPVQSRSIELNREDYSIAYISCQGVDSIPVLVLSKYTEYLFSEELAFHYQLNFENKIEELQSGIFIEYSILEDKNKRSNIPAFTMTPLGKLSNDLGIPFFAIVDDRYFVETIE